MGLQHSSSCYNNNYCLHNEYDDKNYFKIRHHNIAKNNQTMINTNKTKEDKDIQEIDQTFDEIIQTSLQINNDNIYSNDACDDSDSNQSVLTVISPTKDRQIR